MAFGKGGNKAPGGKGLFGRGAERKQKVPELSPEDKNFAQIALSIFKYEMPDKQIGDPNGFGRYVISHLTPEERKQVLHEMNVERKFDFAKKILPKLLDSYERGDAPLPSPAPVLGEVMSSRHLPRKESKVKEKATRSPQSKESDPPPVTPSEKAMMALIDKPFDTWTEEDKVHAKEMLSMQGRAIDAYRQREQEVFKPAIENLRFALERVKSGNVEGLSPETVELLKEMSHIRDGVSSIPEEHRERWLVSVLKKVGAAEHIPYARDRVSETTSKVSQAILESQIELQARGLPLPQNVAIFRKDKPLMEVAAILGSGGAKSLVGLAEGGTLATFALLIRQELWGTTFAFGSPEHIISTAVITALTTPFIEAGAGTLAGNPIQRGESIKKSFGRLARRGALALTLASGFTMASSVVQPHTVATALGNAAQTGGLGAEATRGKESVQRQISNLTPVAQRIISTVASVEQETIETEISGAQVAGRGGTGSRGIGPSAGFKIGFLRAGNWSGEFEQQYGSIPASALDDVQRGREARTALMLLLPEADRAASENLTVDEIIQNRYGTFERDTEDERARIVQRFRELGATAVDVDFWMRNPLAVKAALTIGYTPPGQRVIDERVRMALIPIMALQDRYAQFTHEVQQILETTGSTLNAASGGHEGAIDIEANPVPIDTHLLRELHVTGGISLSDLGMPYEVGAEHYFGGNDLTRTASYALLIFSLMNALIFGSKAFFAIANRSRYRRLQGEAEEQYQYTTANKDGYLEQFSNLMSERLSALFAEEGGVFGNPVAQDQLRLATDRKWIDLSSEMVRVALLEIASELGPVESTGTQGMVEGLLHTYVEGWNDLISRGTPPEVIAQNAVTALLRDHPELSQKLTEKLFPGYYELEQLMVQQQDRIASLTLKDVRALDSRLYPVIIGHLERRVEIEETKLAWCRRAFAKFTKTGALSELGVGVLEELDEAPVDLKEIGLFDETGLNPQKLAGSAVRRATIRSLASHMRSASVAINEVRSLAHDLNESSTRKGAMMQSMSDAATYRRIDDLITRLDKIKPFEEVGSEEVEALTPRGTIEIAAQEGVIEDIKGQMGIIAEEDAREDAETLHRRVASQFDALSHVAKEFWSWEKIRTDSPHKDALTDAYRQQAEFRVIPATEETPAPSYGVEFKIVHKESGQNVVDFNYSLARTFSERQTPEEIQRYFLEELRNRGNHAISKLYLDRANRALARQERYAQNVRARPISLNSRKAKEGIQSFFQDFRLRRSGFLHLERLRRGVVSLNQKLSTSHFETGEELVDDTAIDTAARMSRKALAPFKEISTAAESFDIPLISVRLPQAQLEKIARDVKELRGVKMTFDQEADSMRITQSGFIGINSKTVSVPLTEFKRLYDDRQQNLARVITSVFSKNTSSKQNEESGNEGVDERRAA